MTLGVTLGLLRNKDVVAVGVSFLDVARRFR